MKLSTKTNRFPHTFSKARALECNYSVNVTRPCPASSEILRKSPDPFPGGRGLGTRLPFCWTKKSFESHQTLPRWEGSGNETMSCPAGGVWVAVTREFERDNCVISEILQSDWTIPNRAGVPRKSTKVPRPSFRVWAGRSGYETTPYAQRSRWAWPSA